MAPAAEEMIWGDEIENGVDLEGGASSSGNGSVAAPESEVDRGWQKVTNPKKVRRQEKAAKLKGGEASAQNVAEDDGESKAFHVLEKQAEARRARRKSRNDAWASANGNHTQEAAGEHHSDDDELEDRPHAANEEVKKKSKRVKKAKVSLRAAAEGIDSTDLQSYLQDLSASLAAAPDVQLIRCTDYFEKAFSSISPSLFAWEAITKDSLQRSIDIPVHDIPEEVSKVTSNWLSKHPLEPLSDFTVWALGELVDAPAQHTGRKPPPAAPSKTKAAVSVVLALLLRRKPEALLVRADVLRGSRFQGPTKLHTLAWAYGQVAKGDAVSGVALWVQNLLPHAVGNSGTPISRDLALQLIESIGHDKKTRASLLNNASRKGERLVPPSTLITLLYMSFPSESSRTKATDRFLLMYPAIKEVALAGTFRSKALKHVAQQLFPMALGAAAEDAAGLSEEACSICRWCLAQAPECYKLWEKLYADRLKASTCLLVYLQSNWKESESLLAPLFDLKRTVAAFRAQNLKALEKKAGEEVKAADKQCRLIQKKTSSLPSCIKSSATLAFVAAMGCSLVFLNPNVNPWGWDGKLLLSKTLHFM